jgi:hypothetical protein
MKGRRRAALISAVIKHVGMAVSMLNEGADMNACAAIEGLTALNLCLRSLWSEYPPPGSHGWEHVHRCLTENHGPVKHSL